MPFGVPLFGKTGGKPTAHRKAGLQGQKGCAENGGGRHRPAGGSRAARGGRTGKTGRQPRPRSRRGRGAGTRGSGAGASFTARGGRAHREAGACRGGESEDVPRRGVGCAVPCCGAGRRGDRGFIRRPARGAAWRGDRGFIRRLRPQGGRKRAAGETAGWKFAVRDRVQGQGPGFHAARGRQTRPRGEKPRDEKLRGGDTPGRKAAGRGHRGAKRLRGTPRGEKPRDGNAAGRTFPAGSREREKGTGKKAGTPAKRRLKKAGKSGILRAAERTGWYGAVVEARLGGDRPGRAGI